MGETVTEIIELMRAAAAPGQARPRPGAVRRLRDLTRSLIAAKADAAAEHSRFRAVRERGLELPAGELAARLDGAVILVTGGTGCIGSALMAQLAPRRTARPARLVSVSRGVTTGWARQARAEYRNADIRDRAALEALVAEVRPDVIFHVAAQRDPGLAETEVHRTISTNVLGTRNVLSAATRAGVPRVVHASTGKALRPYSPEVYTASKRAAEWLACEASRSAGPACSAARFTHVVDNSIIYRRLLAWAGQDPAGCPEAIRLHSPDIAFYVQSARESAQLLLLAFLGAGPGEFRVHAITDLGMPVTLLDLALAVLAGARSPVPLYFSGYDAGYEEFPFPGLYDPLTAGDVSPLVNAYEAASAAQSPSPAAGAFRLEFAASSRLPRHLAALAGDCDRTRDPDRLRGRLSDLSWALLDATLRAAAQRAAPRRALERSAIGAKRHWDTMSPGHRRWLEAIHDALGHG